MSNRNTRNRTNPRLLIGLLVGAMAIAGCSGTAATAPANTLALAPSPATLPADSSSPAASPSPTLDAIALAAQPYLAVATRLDAATKDLGTLSSTATLAQIKAYYTSLAAIHADGVAGVQAITFPTRMRDDVENLVRATNAVQAAETNIAAFASLAQVSARAAGLAPAFEAMGEATNNLRSHLGLATVAAAVPPPTLRPSPTPSGASSTDPGVALRIAPPYTLAPLNAAMTAQFQAQLKVALGTLANSFQLGVRWVMQGTEQVALVMNMQVPGAGSAVTSPEFLNQISAGMAGVSADAVGSTTILGVPVRTTQRSGVPLAVYSQEEGVVIVLGVFG